jgi:predicted permease
MFETLRQDIRYAIRSLARRPVITSVAVLSLAFGIGVNTAIFSVFERFLLRRLPVQSPGDLVLVTSPGPRPGGSSSNNSGGQSHVFSYPLFRDLERLEGTGLRLAAHRNFGGNLAHGGQSEQVDGLLVSGGYFSTLGLQPVLGRLFTPDDDRTSGGHPLVVLTHRYWTLSFGADPDVIGSTVTLNGEPMTVLGVGPPGFDGTTLMSAVQIFVPLTQTLRMRAGTEERNSHTIYVFGRLAPGFTAERAQAAINVPFTALIKEVEFPVHRSNLAGRAVEGFLSRQIVLEDGSRERHSGRDEIRVVMVLLLSVTGLVLLIACANLANLMLARAADRAEEIGVRLSLGASTRRIVRLFTTEAAVIGLLGVGVGLIVGRVAFDAMMSMVPPDDATGIVFELNRSMLLFTLGLGLGTTLIFGLFPAVHMLRSTGATRVRAAGRASDTRSTTRFRTALATAQIALATALLAVAGLFITSLTNVAGTDLGIRREGLVTFRVSPFLNGYTPDQTLGLVDRVNEELRGVAGVTGVTASSVPILSGSNTQRGVKVEGFAAGPDDDVITSYAATAADYVRTVGMQLLAGREFTRADAETDAPKVAIVNEAFARKFGLGSQVLGKRLAVGVGESLPLDIEIVGLVRDAKYSEVRDPAPPQLFVPLRPAGPVVFYARTSSDARQLLALIPGIVRRIDSNLPVERLFTMDDQLWDNMTLDRILATLSTWFAGLATVLAGIGLYALLAYTVSQRLREIGIRVALGARPGDVGRLVLGHVGRIAAIGGVIGLLAALGLGRLGRTLLFGVEGSDPVVILAAVVGMVSVAFAAAAYPTRRATQVDPVIALRAE